MLLGLFFGWMIAFPFNGRILYVFIEQHSYQGVSLGLTFTLFHALGLLASAWLSGKRVLWDKSMRIGLWLCVLTYAALFLSGNSLYPFIMAISGAASGVFIMGWSFPYIQKVSLTGRTSFMALTIIIANVFSELVNVAAMYMPPYALYVFTGIPLAASVWLARSVTAVSYSFTTPALERKYPGKLMLLLCLLVMALNLNGGLILNVVYPSYAGLESIAAYFRCIPYLAVLLIFFLRPGTFSAKLHPVYLSAALMGFSFISFALLTDSLPGYFLTETFSQIAFALLDLFVWTVFGNIAQNSQKPSWIFGLGLFANVIAVYAGGIAGNHIISLENHYTVTAFFAAAAIFLTMAIAPYLNACIEENLIFKIHNSQTPDNEPASLTDKQITKGLQGLLEKSLTGREQEIVLLILEGNSNQYIYEHLCISKNTLKTHSRSIFRKLGVSNRRELLALALDLRNMEAEKNFAAFTADDIKDRRS